LKINHSSLNISQQHETHPLCKTPPPPPPLSPPPTKTSYPWRKSRTTRTRFNSSKPTFPPFLSTLRWSDSYTYWICVRMRMCVCPHMCVVCLYEYVYAHKCILVYTCVHNILVYSHMYVHIHQYIHVCIYACIYAHVYSAYTYIASGHVLTAHSAIMMLWLLYAYVCTQVCSGRYGVATIIGLFCKRALSKRLFLQKRPILLTSLCTQVCRVYAYIACIQRLCVRMYCMHIEIALHTCV